MSLGISAKCRAIAPSATLAMDTKAKTMQAKGKTVYSFAAGEPDFDTAEHIRNAMKEAMDMGMTRYTAVPGTFELKNAIIQRFQADSGLEYTRDEIIVSNGAKHSLYTAFQAILDPGDEVLIPTPCWVSYPEIVRMADGIPVFIPCDEASAFVPTIADIAAKVTSKTKAFILTTPSNPNGCVWDKDILQALADLAVERDFYIISDEIYEKLIYDGRKHVSIATLGDKVKERTILINGVSKSYAMTGFRIGYAAGPKDVIKAMSTYQSQATSAPNSAAQHAATVALTGDQTCVETMRQAFEERRDTIVELINQISGVSCQKPSGAFYVMMNIKNLLGKHFEGNVINDCVAFADALLTSQQVVVVPGTAFMAPGYCRLSYAISMENIREGMRRIAAFVKELS